MERGIRSKHGGLLIYQQFIYRKFQLITMKVKFLYNTLLTVGIALMFLSTIAAYNSGQTTIMYASIAVAALLVWLKVQLLKQVQQSTKKPKTNQNEPVTGGQRKKGGKK